MIYIEDEIYQINDAYYKVRHVNQGCAWLSLLEDWLADVKLDSKGYTVDGQKAIKIDHLKQSGAV